MRKRPRGAAEMPFLDHLEELRWRLLKIIAALIVCAIIGFMIVSRYNVLELLIDPIRPLIGAQGRLKYLSPGDPFFITLGLAFTVGGLLAFPIVASQIWGFIAPALLPREKRAIVPALYLGLLLFIGGVSLGYYVVLPMTLRFFMSFQSASLEQNIVIGPYIGLVVKILLAFGALFELPVVILVLSALGLVTSKFLSEKRRFAIAGIAILAAVATPGDAVTLTIFLMGPLILLYELSIVLAKLMERRRAKALITAAALFAATMLFAPPASAQRPLPGQQQPAPQAAARQPAAPLIQDTARPKTTREVVMSRLRTLNQAEVRDTTVRDTTLRQPGAVTAKRPNQPAVDFPTDSVMRELMKLGEYAVTQYRGSAAQFRADSDQLIIYGKADEKAGVVREGETMTADSLLTFDEQTSIACGYGKPVLTGDATDAPLESRVVCYNTRAKIGVAMGARTQVSEGANWIVTGDLYTKGNDAYTHNAKFTDCSLEIPHYHFSAKEVKVSNRNVLVARNVTLNFGDVPVFWLPFMMQSLKQGRRTGILMPEFSVNDIVRRNSSYNRRISNVGFYWAISDKLGSRLALDWFSNNYTAVEGSFDYNLPNQFIQGGATFKRFWEASGGKQFTLAANHSWQPNERTNVAIDAQYATSSAFIQQRSYDPRELRRSIISNAGVNRRFNWGSVSTQASRTHYLTDDKIDYTLPSVGVTFSTVTLFPATGATHWFSNATWTSSAQLRRTATDYKKSDFDPSGLTGNVNSTFTIGSLSWSQSFDATNNRAAHLVHGDSTLTADQRMTWRSSLNFQQRLIGTTTFTPGISIVQDMLRTDTLANNKLFTAPLRLDANAALKMDMFGFWPGIGPMTKLRHRFSPNITYSYSPSAAISAQDSLKQKIFGRANVREQNRISIGLSQTIEGKYKEEEKRAGQRADSAAVDSTSVDPTKPRRLPQARKVTILSLNTDAVVYDFVAARDSLHLGVQTTQISNSINSDLLRGLQLTVTHELFKPRSVPDGATLLAGERQFSPHLSRVSASFSLSNNSWLFKFFGIGKQHDAPPATGSQETPVSGNAQGGIQPTNAARPEYGLIGNRANETGPPPRGPLGSWNASFNLTLERPRADAIGTGQRGNQMVTTTFTFQPTQQWNVNWNTGYSFTDKSFTDHILTFTRQMHDWDANFDFIKAQNGNFSFQFRVKLRANPDIKFDYNQRSNVAPRQTGF